MQPAAATLDASLACVREALLALVLSVSVRLRAISTTTVFGRSSGHRAGLRTRLAPRLELRDCTTAGARLQAESPASPPPLRPLRRPLSLRHAE